MKRSLQYQVQGDEEEVEYIKEDGLESDQCTKVKLHQRFSSLYTTLSSIGFHAFSNLNNTHTFSE